MATLSLDIPDAIVPELAAALAARLGVAVPATNAARAQLARDWIKQEAKAALDDWRAQEAGKAARGKPDLGGW